MRWPANNAIMLVSVYRFHKLTMKFGRFDMSRSLVSSEWYEEGSVAC